MRFFPQRDLADGNGPRRGRWGRTVSWLVIGIFTAYCGVIVFFTSLQRSMIYASQPATVSLAGSGLSADLAREIVVPASDGTQLHGWLARAAEPALAQSPGLVIFFSGNAGNRAARVPVLQDFNNCGWDALICDYRGYADNAGQPSEAALSSDARDIFKYACTTLGYEASRIVLCGQSLGGGIATRLAWELCQAGTPPAGLILRATFTSLTDTASRLYPWLPVRWVLVDRYPSIERIGKVTCPVLVVHGELDTIVPVQQGQQLFAAAPASSHSGLPKAALWLPDAGHNDLQALAAPQLHEAHLSFLKSIAQSLQTTPGAAP